MGIKSSNFGRRVLRYPSVVTQNHFVIPAAVLEKFRSRGFPEGVTLTADHCTCSCWSGAWRGPRGRTTATTPTGRRPRDCPKGSTSSRSTSWRSAGFTGPGDSHLLLGYCLLTAYLLLTYCRCIKKLKECNGDVGVALEELLSDFLQIDNEDDRSRGGAIPRNLESGIAIPSAYSAYRIL